MTLIKVATINRLENDKETISLPKDLGHPIHIKVIFLNFLVGGVVMVVVSALQEDLYFGVGLVFNIINFIGFSSH